MKSFYLTLLFIAISLAAFAETAQFKIEIEPDNWPYEIGWTLVDSDDNIIYQAVNSESTEIALPNDGCYHLQVTDTYGDGIQSNNGISIFWNELLIEQIAGDFGNTFNKSFNCPIRTTCASAEIVELGDYNIYRQKEWFQFTATQSGRYSISTCNNSNNCNTKIAAFENCYADINSNNVQGTVLFNDNFCNEKAKVETVLDAGTTLVIKIEAEDFNCNGQAINWSINYEGEAEGCTDAAASNFQPRATIDNGTCIYASMNNGVGPDLIIVQEDLVSSMYHQVIENTDECMIEEGCLTGYGNRDVIRFTTNIKNVGTADYVVGTTAYYPDQFTFDNCHQHWHYDGYAEYILYNEAGAQIPVGFKNGFCVEDLQCSGGAGFNYNCFYMGITAGCSDVYSAEIDCQWVDVTNVPSGNYTLVMKVNWDNAPDAVGNYELDHTNNFAQACFNIDRDANGQMQFNLVNPCPTFLDCQGNPYGTAAFDCENVCAGTSYFGDIDANLNIDLLDADTYINAALTNNMVANNCNDVSLDGEISLFDAALIVACNNYQQGHEHDNGTLHNHCNLPGGILNTNDSVYFKISIVNELEGYFDVEVKNKNNRIMGYQLKFDGIGIQSVESLIDPIDYDETIQYINGMNGIIAMSYTEQLIDKDLFYKPLCRVYYKGDHIGFTCINASIDVINHNYEKTLTFLDEPCRFLGPVGVEGLFNKSIQIQPNPFTEFAKITIENFAANDAYDLFLFNLNGELLRIESKINSNSFTLFKEELTAGTYLLQLKSKDWQHTFKTIIY